jgi:hypothetical protein
VLETIYKSRRPRNSIYLVLGMKFGSTTDTPKLTGIGRENNEQSTIGGSKKPQSGQRRGQDCRIRKTKT